MSAASSGKKPGGTASKATNLKPLAMTITATMSRLATRLIFAPFPATTPSSRAPTDETSGNTVAMFWTSIGRSALLLKSAAQSDDKPQRADGMSFAFMGQNRDSSGISPGGGTESVFLMIQNWRRRPDLNRGWRFCRPLPYHLATAPIGLKGRISGLSAHATADSVHGGVLDPATFTPHSQAKVGAGNGIRTRDFDLGKVALYH